MKLTPIYELFGDDEGSSPKKGKGKTTMTYDEPLKTPMKSLRKSTGLLISKIIIEEDVDMEEDKFLNQRSEEEAQIERFQREEQKKEEESMKGRFCLLLSQLHDIKM
ncbi:hypothetical protein L1887_26597 [Cichorium endivia]|nr:hypothetical protein L1887_26597 [Cichorium endivia]